MGAPVSRRRPTFVERVEITHECTACLAGPFEWCYKIRGHDTTSRALWLHAARYWAAFYAGDLPLTGDVRNNPQ